MIPITSPPATDTATSGMLRMSSRLTRHTAPSEMSGGFLEFISALSNNHDAIGGASEGIGSRQ
jgi:hypothetical protein